MMPFQFLLNDMYMGGKPGLTGLAGWTALAGAQIDFDFAANRDLLLGPDIVTNGTFDTNITGWTPYASGGGSTAGIVWDASGKLSVAGNGTGTSGVSAPITTTIGVTYEVTIVVAGQATNFIILNAAPASGGPIASILAFPGVPATCTLRFTATTSTSWIYFYRGNVGAALIDNVTAREVDPPGPNLITNGTFATDTTGWTTSLSTIASVGGELQITSTGTGSEAAAGQLITTVPGQTYSVTWTGRQGTSSTIRVAATMGGSPFTQLASDATFSAVNVTRTFTFIAVSTTTTISPRGYCATAGLTTFFDNISVREVSVPLDRMLTVSRASPGMAQRGDGSWQTFAANVARRTDRGLLCEEGRTNQIRNNAMQGAVVGTPGTAPTNWSFINASGLTFSLVEIGVQGGVDFVVVRLQGTANAGSSAQLAFEAATGVAALQNETRTLSAFVELVAGSMSGIASMRLRQQPRAAGGATQGSTIDGTLFDPTSSFVRQTFTATLPADALIAAVQPLIAFTPTNGAAVDITLRIGMPQLELGSWATSPIRTTGSAASRNTDVVTYPFTPGSTTQGTLFADATYLAPDNNVFSQPAASFDDGTLNHRLQAYRITGGGAGYVGGTGSAGNQAGPTVPIAQGATAPVVVAFSPSSQIQAISGISGANTLPVTAVLGTKLSLGVRSEGGSSLNGYLRRATYWPVRLSDTNVVRLSLRQPLQ